MDAIKGTISYPTGLVSPIVRWVDGVPGLNLPHEAAHQRVREELYPLRTAQEGYIYVTPAAANTLTVGDPIQVDRVHATISAIGEPERVEDSRGKQLACRVSLASPEYV